MPDVPALPPDETGFDVVLGFSLPERDVRGRCVRLGPVLDTVLSAHDYPGPIRHLLSEALLVATLIGSLGKEDRSQMTMQAQSANGIVDMLVCDYRDGELRGYVRFDAERLDDLGANPPLSALVGTEAYLAITFDVADGGRYQGIVPLNAASLSDACEAYFRQSEQLPTVLRIAVQSQDGHCVAGGLLLQYLPDGEEGRERLHVRHDDPNWEHVEIISSSVRHSELADPALSLEALLWRLFHEEAELRVETIAKLVRGCRCSADHYHAVLSRFGSAELDEMRDDDGLIRVDCAFCSRIFPVEV
ncbi:Hsp33 family molecular chaperone HslO [Croceicoccus marinus]|uniref:Molecular chaperone Hsp33 n=1 Tax=Croceicoccus marinus TaxID=450378 RepID=A0A1Z1F866_9SPHN|nr:Hsp33 family molecular chaperone HslO [Croceicoccus marinus]ARU14917.1 molecular chaperone Hsp33 [Croceicoccus marinus]